MAFTEKQIEEMKVQYAEKGKLSQKVASVDEIDQVVNALSLYRWYVHQGQRGFARKWGVNRSLAERFAKKGWLELEAIKRDGDAHELELYLTHWIPVARGQVLAESGGAGVGPYDYNGDSSRVEHFIYSYGTDEEIEFMQTMFKRIYATTSLPFDIYYRLSCCMLKKFDYKWYMKHWGDKEWGEQATAAMDKWVDITPMEPDRAHRLLGSFLQACKDASEAYIAQHPVDHGMCGFANVEIPTSDPFGKWVAEQHDQSMAYDGGAYVSLYSKVPGRQDIDYNKAVYLAGCNALRENGVNAKFGYNLD